ncbi:Hypothetical_protein [Hexamita inflata]|uniref:Hypothetical_protein n=1 Tax=Hexamita inflata TaxID=28002 RepID=A0AA86UXI0_9EUKA|nr:Hypothetical protein HINF_LOCUS59579 [Hexamita inflata]
MNQFVNAYQTDVYIAQLPETSQNIKYCYILIDGANNSQQSESRTKITDQNDNNLLIKPGHYFIIKFGQEYLMPYIQKQNGCIKLKFEQNVSGKWIPDFDFEKFMTSDQDFINSLNSYRNKSTEKIEMLKIGDQRMTKDKKDQIMNYFRNNNDGFSMIQEYNRRQFTIQRTKQSMSKLYIKIKHYYGTGNYIRVKVIDEFGKNKLLYGDYYELQVGNEYCFYTQLIVGEKFQLTFSDSVDFEWIPDFPIDLDSSTGIQIVRRGEYYPSNKYYFKDYDCSEEVEVTGRITIRAVSSPHNDLEYNSPDFKQIANIKRHEKLTITKLHGDFGFTKYKGKECWICIRFVTVLGSEGGCDCNDCKKRFLKQQPCQIYYPSSTNPILRNAILNEQIMYQIYDQYMLCMCSHCKQIKEQSFELSINPKFDAIQQFYQKNGRCVNITDVTTYINAKFQETYTDD